MDASSIPRYNVFFTGIAKTLRILELCFALLLLSWLFTHLRPSADYLRRLSSFLGSPLFVFAISNAIIAALFAQSSRLSSTHADTDTDTATISSSSYSSSLPRVAEEPDEVECLKKLIMGRPESDTCTVTGKDYCCVAAVTDSSSDLGKVYRRSQSENSKGSGEEGKRMARRKLRRSETEKARYPEDKLSNEEFQRTIEAFIAKQMRFLKEQQQQA